MKLKHLAAALLAALCLAACTPQPGGGASTAPVPAQSIPAAADIGTQPRQDAAEELFAILQAQPLKRPATLDFLLWCEEEVAAGFCETILAEMEQNGWQENLVYQLFGASLLYLQDTYTGAADTDPYLHLMPQRQGPVTLAFTGDINLADDWEILPVLRAEGGNVDACFSPALLQRMREADVLLINNEFSFSDRGAPMAGKQYTFRAATENADILHQIGADLVSLANNHVYDYGADAFIDTLDTLAGAAIPYVGAGRDITEAMQPQYFLVGGMKIAYVAASRAEKYILTPEATADAAGVLRCYDDTLFLQAVQTAAQNADIVVAYPHWGTENTTVLEDVQVELAHKLVDAGADLVVGAHPHVLQGLEFYEGGMIAYSLGNFWFNTNRVDTALLEIVVHAPGSYEMVVQPCLQTGGKVYLLEEEDARSALFRHLEGISPVEVAIAEDGRVTPA